MAVEDAEEKKQLRAKPQQDYNAACLAEKQKIPIKKKSFISLYITLETSLLTI